MDAASLPAPTTATPVPAPDSSVIALTKLLVGTAKDAGTPGVIALFIGTGLVAVALVWCLPRIADAVGRVRFGVTKREQELERRVHQLEAIVNGLQHRLEEQAALFEALAERLGDHPEVGMLRAAFAATPRPADAGAVQ